MVEKHWSVFNHHKCPNIQDEGGNLSGRNENAENTLNNNKYQKNDVKRKQHGFWDINNIFGYLNIICYRTNYPA